MKSLLRRSLSVTRGSLNNISVSSRTAMSAESAPNGAGGGGGVFISHLNPMTGKAEWTMQPEDYDYQQEVARAAFADMLHDSERNRLYYKGLEAAIALKRAKGEPVHVLDIGTGTGLLSMMAAKIGADSVTAVEEFRPMADCATRVIAANGFADQIKLVRKRSTNVQVGEGLDMERRANILVTEVFDTELIGEAAISIFNHAHKILLTNDCLVVPSFGTIYAQVVSSDVCERWNKLRALDLGDGDHMNPPSTDASSSCSLALHDLQLSQMKEEWFQPLTDPIQVFDFDFSGKSGPIPLDDQTVRKANSLRSGHSSAVFMWWDLKMDPEHKITLSCAPHWAHPLGKVAASQQVSGGGGQVGFSHDNNSGVPWRDHWMQSVYYPVSTDHVVAACGEEICVISNHDEFSLWFDVRKESPLGDVPMPDPTCGIHLAVSRSRLGQMNDPSRNSTLMASLKKAIAGLDAPPTCLCLSELSLMPLLACKLGAAKVYVAEENRQMRDVLEKYAKENGLGKKLVVLEKSVAELKGDEWSGEKIDLILAEPNFSMSLLPWHNLRYWYSLSHLRDQTSDTGAVILPRGAELWGVPMHYEHLWKIRSPLYQVEGFEMKHFDEIIEGASDTSDANVEPHPLWEYPGRAQSAPAMLIKFDFAQKVPKKNVEKEVVFDLGGGFGNTNGMAFWMVWHLDKKHSVSSGPVSSVTPGINIDWDLHSKQGVLFFKSSALCQKGITKVMGKVVLRPKEGDIAFEFNLA